MVTIDASNWDHDTWNPPCLKAAGVERVIMGCQRPALASPMIVAARSAGIVVRDLYAFLYMGIDTIGQVNGAIAVAESVGGIKTIWLDCESTGDLEAKGLTPAARVADLANCVALVRSHGYRPGIYTGTWWWPSHMADSRQFKDLPLWHAAYGPGGGPCPPVREVTYGGWSKVAIHQYTSTLALCGRGRDANYVFEEQETDMTEEQVLALAASQFLPLLAQALGAEKSTFSDTERVENIRSFIQAWIQKNDHTHLSENAQAGTRVPPHKHVLGIAISETGPVQGG